MDKRRLNILIARPSEFLTEQGRRAYGPCIVVRYSYSEVPLDLWPTPDAPLGRGFAATSEVFDPNERNAAGSLGAYCNVYPLDDMRAFVAELRAVWGSLHVQDNTGLLPDLDQGLFR